MSKNVSFGIDLGTTNSCISMMKSNTSVPKIIPLRDGDTIPSCVMLNPDGTLTVGKEAYEHRYEDCCIYSVKRYMGTDKKIVLTNGGLTKTYTPEEISSFILKAIVEQASEYVGEGIIKDVTITVPAHFDDTQRRATKKAGEMAGLNVVNIINEPTSAGLLYGLDDAQGNQTVLVYDLGGGTFDVSILRVTKELRKFPLLDINMNNEYNKTAINIIGNEGDVQLGGDDIDAAVTQFVLEQLSVQSKLGIKKITELIDDYEMEKLKLRVEQSKKANQGVLIYELPGYGKYKLRVIGTPVEEMCYRPIFNRTYELVSKAMATSGITSIDHIVLVGGSTKSPIIRKMLQEKFPHINLYSSFEPDWSVALGASISSATTLGISKIATITDVVPMSIGIIVSNQNGDKILSKILKKDTQLPCVASKEYEIGDSSLSVELDIRQGESTTKIDKLTKIGRLILTPDQYKSKDFAILFKCDLNGVLSCSLLMDGKETQIAINYSANDAVSTKEDIEDLSILDKGQKFFYESHKRKLMKLNVSDEDLRKFYTTLVTQDLTKTKEVFKELSEKYQN